MKASVHTDSLTSVTPAELAKQNLEIRINDFNTQFQKHELQFELYKIPVAEKEGDDLDVKYLEATENSNVLKMKKEELEETMCLVSGDMLPAPVGKEVNGEFNEQDSFETELRRNNELTKNKLFLDNENSS